MLRILVMVPCYNEEASLPKLLTDLFALQLPEKYALSVAVINDCSRDDTGKIALASKAVLLDLPVNLGIGGAVQSGLKYAFRHGFDLAVQMDGDGQHPPKELIKLLNCHAASGANMVIGSRYIEKEGFQSTFFRRMGIAYFHWLNKFFTGINIYDSTSGFRLFDKQAIALGAYYYPDDYPEPESLVVFSRAGLTVRETPVIMVHRSGGQSSIRNFASLYYCVKVSLAMFFSAVRKHK